MSKYMLLLHDDPSGFTAMSPEEMQKVIEKYIAWDTGLRASGVILDGHKLVDDAGRVMRRQDGKLRTTDGPHSESKEVLGGYLVEADSYEPAIEHASTCPHLEYGGTIEVREIQVL